MADPVPELRTKLDGSISKAKSQLIKSINDAFGNLYAETHDLLAGVKIPDNVAITPPTPTPVVVPSDDTAAIGSTYWLGGWSGNVWESVRNVVNKDAQPPTFVGYNIPGRDNGNYSAGGLPNKQAFFDWYGAIADAIGTKKARVIVEPDALGLAPALTAEKRAERYEMIQGAINALNAKPNITIILDASMWIDATLMGQVLNTFTGWDYFSLNVSGFKKTDICISYGDKVAEVTKKRFVIDTSRNGNGNPHEPAWCNVTGTKIGPAPSAVTASRNCAYYLALKVAGESDGKKINGYDGDGQQDRGDVPNAGERWPDYEKAIKSGDWTEFGQKYKVAV